MQTNEVTLRCYSKIPLKYAGDTGVKGIPCTVTDMIDQGVRIADGRFADEDIWEGAGTIISPGIPRGTKKVLRFNDPILAPANLAYCGVAIVDFSDRVEPKTAYFVVSAAPAL